MQILNLHRKMSNPPTTTTASRFCYFGLGLAVVLTLIAGSVIALKPARIVSAQAPSAGPNEPPFRPQRVYLPHWSNEQGFSTTIFIRNVNIKSAVNAKLSLILDQRTVTLAPINIPALQTVPVDIAQALNARHEDDSRSGGAFIDFEAQSAGSVNAYAQVLDTNKSLSFSFPFMERITSVAEPFEAVAFFYSKKTDGYVALQNTTDAAVTVTPTAFYADRIINLGHRQIPSHQTVMIKLPEAPDETGNSRAFSVGLRVESSGSAGAIVAQGWVVEKNTGFSVPFAFHTPGSCNCSDQTQHLYGAGVAIGAGAMMGMTPGAIFSPYLAVRNRSNSALSVKPVFSYETAQGTRKVTLPTINLNAQANTLVNLKTYQDEGLIALNAGGGNIDLQYQGEPGALVAELTSTDQYGTFVSPVPLTCTGNRALHQSYWRTDGDWHSMLTLQNIAPEENDVEITVSYPGGVYVVNKKMAAGATVMLSVNELQQAQTPDANGHRIPLTAKTGGINVWSRNQNTGLVMNAMLMNPVTKTCGSCNGGGYVNWSYLTDVYGGSGFGTHQVGDNISLYMQLHWTTSNYSNDYPSLQSTSNPAVVDSSLQAVGAGSATLFAESGQNYPTNVVCSTYNHLTASASCEVQNMDFTITLNKNNIKPTGIIAGLNGADPAIPVADTQATITVATNPPTANVAVSLSLATGGQTDWGNGNHVNHTGTRPLGTLSQASGTTDQSGVFTSVYTAPVFGGIHKFSATVNNVTKFVLAPVGIPDLYALQAGNDYTLDGQKSWHPGNDNNHYGTAIAVAALPLICSDYKATYPGATNPEINDMSLPFGGKYDLDHDWSNVGDTGHAEHRVGRNCDFETTGIPSNRWAALNQMFINRNVQDVHDETAHGHWHLRFRTQ